MKTLMNYCVTVFSCVLMMLCSINNTYSKEKIQWYQADFPPAFIIHGDNVGTGYVDKMNQDVIAALKEYEHIFTEGNYRRIVESLKNRDNACCASIYKTAEREQFSAYSEPLFIGFSNGVIITREKVKQYEQYITPEQTIDLRELIKQENEIVIGIIGGRNYGPIEDVIAPIRNTSKIYERSGTDSKGVTQMLLHNRIDMILALPMEIAFTVNQLGIDKDAIVFYQIKDGEPYTISYMACSGTDFGKKVIETINTVIQQRRGVFAKYYRDWLDETSAKTYSALVEKVFGINIPAD